jgi:hypothetical protein
MSTNNFYECLSKSTLVEYMLNKAMYLDDSKWKHFLDMNLFTLTIDDFELEPKLIELINAFDCQNKLAIYRYKPNFCYQWHVDSIRNCALNLQLLGNNSFCMFGEYYEPRKFRNLQQLAYKENTYYLLNVNNYHTVFNFENDRYLLSIGFPKPHTFEDVKQYLIDHNI